MSTQAPYSTAKLEIGQHRAPCGHPGEAIIGQFILCRRCDLGEERCSKCGSGETERFVAPGLPPDARHCWRCGHVQWAGVSAEAD